MFEILGKSTETCVGFKASGKVNAADYEALLPKLDAAKADFKFGTKQYRSVERCAFVTDKKWHQWVVELKGA